MDSGQLHTHFSAPSDDEGRPVMRYCPNCGFSILRLVQSLPDICPGCQDMTTWQTHPPRHVRARGWGRKRQKA